MPEISLLDDVILTIFRVNARLLEKGDQLVMPLNLTSARWQVIGAVELAQKPISAPQIAEFMGMSRQGVQKQLNKLLEEGYFESIHNPRHERSPLYTITKRGSDVLNETRELHQAWERSIGKNLSTEDLKKTLQVLQTLFRDLAQPVPTIDQINAENKNHE